MTDIKDTKLLTPVGILGPDGKVHEAKAPAIITDMDEHRRLEQSEEQQHIQQEYECRELCHMSRPFEDLAQAVSVGGGTIIFMQDIHNKYPQFTPYLQDHHFHIETGTEHLVFNTVAFIEEPEVLEALLNDCFFRIVTFARMGGKSMSARERAVELMAKIKNIDPADAVQELDPDLALAIQQRGSQDTEAGGLN